jgi:glycosyltransferase involved in cell wall biosynthesis
MRILIDAHMIGEQESGNERYLLNLIASLTELAPPAEFIVAASHPELVQKILLDRTRWRVEPVSAPAWRRLGFELPALVRRERVDLLHVTYAAPLWPGCRVLTTVHDVSYRSHPAWFSIRDRCVLRAGVGLTLAAGAGVITISEHSRMEISRYYGVPQNRIQVTRLAGDPCFRQPSNGGPTVDLNRLGIRSPYILAVGNLQPRKNLGGLIRAVAELKRKKAGPFQLVIAGKAKWRESDLFSEVRRQGLETEVCFLGYVTDETLTALYRQAAVFVYPSLYEGFGLPLLEAMSCGAPVVTTRCTSIPEVVGEAALMVEATDTSAMADAIGRVLEDESFQASLREKGLKQAAQFSWARTARETWDVYRRAVEGT